MDEMDDGGTCMRTKGNTFAVQASTDGNGGGWRERKTLSVRNALMHIKYQGWANHRHQNLITVRAAFVDNQKRNKCVGEGTEC